MATMSTEPATDSWIFRRLNGSRWTLPNACMHAWFSVFPLTMLARILFGFELSMPPTHQRTTVTRSAFCTRHNDKHTNQLNQLTQELHDSPAPNVLRSGTNYYFRRGEFLIPVVNFLHMYWSNHVTSISVIAMASGAAENSSQQIKCAPAVWFRRTGFFACDERAERMPLW